MNGSDSPDVLHVAAMGAATISRRVPRGKAQVASGKIKRRQPGSERVSKPVNKGWRRGAVNVFILFHLIAITCWALPVNWLPVVAVRALVRPYMLWTGLFQSWDAFAPNPPETSTYFKAVVITKHHVHVWDFPRMEELSFGQRYEKERYRKFQENMLRDQSAPTLPDIVRHIARYYDDTSDPPQKVMLIRYQSDITPESNDEHEDRPKVMDFWDEYIEPGDLQ